MRVVKWLAIGLAMLCALIAAFVAGALTYGSLDIFCPGDYLPHITTETVTIAPGVQLDAGTPLLIRYCEYADQGRLDFPVDRSLMPGIKPRTPAE